MTDEHKHSKHKNNEDNSVEANPDEANIEGNETANKEVESLKEKITGLEKVINDQNDRLLRTLAEIENLRRRSAEDLEKANKYAIAKFAGELVSVVEHLYLAIDNMPHEEIKTSDKLNNFAQGVTMTQKELVKIFEKNGIKRINPLNENFDHNFHEAIARVECDKESGIVTKVIQAGYTVHDRLIKPALVEVSA